MVEDVLLRLKDLTQYTLVLETDRDVKYELVSLVADLIEVFALYVVLEVVEVVVAGVVGVDVVVLDPVAVGLDPLPN